MNFNGEKDFLLSLYSFNNKLTPNYKIKKLYIISNNTNKYYKTFTIKKHNGGKRTITSPYYELKMLQKNILKELLYDKRPSSYATAYIKEKNILNNVLVHKNKKFILKLDITNFFDNISYVDIFNIYKEYGFSNRLCGLLAHLTTLDSKLPQGAPTSPFLSNLVLRDFDYKIGKWCEERNINYTRYSDDMTFSMNEYNKEIIPFIRKNLYKYGLEINNKKINIINNSHKQKITGIVVNEKIQVDKEYRKRIRQEVYYIKKYGLSSHLKKCNIINKNKYLNSLYGRINYILMVDSNNKEFQKYKEYILNLK